ncbi:competence protein ComEA [Anoxybacillus tepidamans]|uniref:Competence protein ComEA n=1 Tax=Anoxybacteroides tepidamans TaxID=265948 RepID=A0A7W8MVD3_9BACL|nr:helix-hairpin-helix domain-containing protein [Anoxybacillus tepidamans]MBB5324778.1 competence protein ComEA [Anoxybacillus tepidamans]
MWQWGKKYEKQWYVLALIAIVATVIFIYSDREQEQSFALTADPPLEQKNAAEMNEEQEQQQPIALFVDVKGAVARPGVYEVTEHARVKDVIAMAGGLTKEADHTKVNLAAKVHDEMIIYVPAKGEVSAPVPSGDSQEEKPKIDINSASLEEIQKIQGIGPAKAAAIIAYREEHGPFRKIEDLLNVSGIGEKSLEKMKEQIIIR